MIGARRVARRLAATFLLVFHSVPAYAFIANPLIGMFAPIGVEWLLISPWSPFYIFWETRWLVFNRISISNFYNINTNAIIGWSMFLVGLCIFLVAAIRFVKERKEKIVVTGLYSKVRHPQYLGIILATLGFTFASERPMAWIAWLNLTFLYLLIASGEEKILQKKCSEEIQKLKQLPFMIPLPKINFSRKLPTLGSRTRKYSVLSLIYVTMTVLAWIFLKQFSYNPGPFWE